MAWHPIMKRDLSVRCRQMEESDVGETNLEATSPFLIQHHVAAESRLAILKLCHKALWVTQVLGLLTIFCAGREKNKYSISALGRACGKRRTAGIQV